MAQTAYIVSAVRTPIGRFGGWLKNYSLVELGAQAMKAALERAGVAGHDLDIYIFGNVLGAGHGQLLPRQAALQAGIPLAIDGYAVNMVCASAMMSVINAATAIKAGEVDLALAGGMESMSQAGFYLSHRARWGYKLLMGVSEELRDLLVWDGLTDPVLGEGMGTQAERLAADRGIGRDELDEIAALSQQRAATATETGTFIKEIVPVKGKSKNGPQLIDQDEGIRADTTAKSLANLRPAFKENGVFTAGNSSQISDGAAALLLASPGAVERYGLKPTARILGSTWVAGETWRFPEAPVPAVKKLLDKLEMGIDDFDLFENNEAFALNNVLFSRMLGVSHDKINILGGAVALGHPIGASGARILVTLLNALADRDGRLGLAAICHGTGGSTALAVERL